MSKRLIVTADDFGLSPAVNEAVEEAHRHGILTSASLMVGAPAAGDAIARARRLPELRVGLHLDLIDGRPVSPPEAIPGLLAADGRFKPAPVANGFGYAFLPGRRSQLAREIRAQFRAFAASGLTLDHANAHKHLHLHPTVGRLLAEIGAQFGLRALRVPDEPQAPLRRVEHRGVAQRLSAAMLAPWIALLRRRVRGARMRANDRVFGIAWSGGMTERRVLGLLAQLPEGLSEIYFHPSTACAPGPAAHNNREDLATLISPAVRLAIERHGIALTSFGES